VKKLKHCLKKRDTKSSWLAVSLSVSCLLISFQIHAQLYEYRDESGRRVFVDRLSAVPPQYREQLIPRDRVTVTPQMREDTQRLQHRAQLEAQIRRVDALLKRSNSAISFANNQVIVPVRVSRGNRTLELSLLLDTGANSTVFHRQALSRLNPDERRIGGARTASGDTIPLYQTQLDRLEIGPFEIAPAAVQMLDYSGDSVHQGLLGMDLLSQVKYEIDFETQVLSWAPEQVAQLRRQREALVAQIAAIDSQPPIIDSMPTVQEKVPSATLVDDRVQ